MARPENWLDQGYVPTPETVIPDIFGANVISVSCHPKWHASDEPDAALVPEPTNITINVLDPCCGDGTALTQIAEQVMASWSLNSNCLQPNETHIVRTWGIEINEDRAKTAKEQLAHCTWGDALDMEFTKDAFDIAWINPPYGHVGDGTGRVETKFLRLAIPAVRPKGVTCYIVQESVAFADLPLFAQWHGSPAIFRFGPNDYPRHNQVVVFGHKLDEPNSFETAKLQAEIIQEDFQYAVNHNRKIPTIGGHADYYARYPLYTFGQSIKVRQPFRPTPVNLAELEESALREGAFNSPVIRRSRDPNAETNTAQPLAAMRQGHIVMAIANGQLNNIRIEDPAGIKPTMIVKGTAYKEEIETSRSVNPETHAKKVESKEHIRASVKTMRLDTGEINTLDEGNGNALANFLSNNWDAISKHCRERFKPQIDPTDSRWWHIRQYYRDINRKPISFQYQTAVTLAAAIKTRRSNFLIGEQGTGKTYLSATAAHAAGMNQILVTLPTHAIDTWVEELLETIPTARVRVAHGIGSDFQPLSAEEHAAPYRIMPLARIKMMEGTPHSPVFALMSKQTARTSHPWHYIDRAITNDPPNRRLYRNEAGNIQKVPEEYAGTPKNGNGICPFCFAFLDTVDVEFRKHPQAKCRNPECKKQLATPNVPPLTPATQSQRQPKTRTISGADYIVRRMSSWADLYICDEVHEMKARQSAQGEECGRIAQTAKRVLAMTGTFMGGKASELFYILQRFGNSVQKDFPYHGGEGSFVNAYGRYKYTYTSKQEYREIQIGTQSRRRDGTKRMPQEIVGFHPKVMDYILPNSIFIRREDMLPQPSQPFPCRRCANNAIYGWDDLCFKCRMNPKLTVEVIKLDQEQSPVDVEFDPDLIFDGFKQAYNPDLPTSQATGYRLVQTVSEYFAKLLLKKMNSLAGFAEMRQNLMTYPENAWKGATVHWPDKLKRGTPPYMKVGPLPENVVYPKEQKLLEMLHRHVNERKRKVLVYVTHTSKRSVQERLEDLLHNNGFRVTVLPKGDARGRIKWLRASTENHDVIIASAKSMETGLNCQQFPVIIWYEIHESMYTTDQASARSARINQLDEVEVNFLVYENTIQHAQLSLIASRSDTSRKIYGELGATGLSALNPDDTDLSQIIQTELAQRLDSSDPSSNDGNLWGAALMTQEQMNEAFVDRSGIQYDQLESYDMGNTSEHQPPVMTAEDETAFEQPIEPETEDQEDQPPIPDETATFAQPKYSHLNENLMREIDEGEQQKAQLSLF